MKILTFDIEEWFHILDHATTETEDNWKCFEYRIEKNIDKILKLLEFNNQSATFFCLGWIARKFPKIIKKIDSMNFEIGSHSDLHQLVYKQDRKQFSEDLKKSIQSIEDLTGKKVTCYRAPGFSIKSVNQSWVFDELIKNGITIDCSIFPASRSHGGFPSFGTGFPAIIDRDGFKIKEFPISLCKIFNKKIIYSGGGYFRLLPYYFIKNIINNSEYVMTYFHPRDFDKGQPLLKDLSMIRRFKSYYGINFAFNKLEHLIQDFNFISLSEADKLIDWSKSKEIRI